MSPKQIEEHDFAIEQAVQMIKGEIISHGNEHPSNPTALVRWKLERALHFFARVLELNPKNWSAMWLVGKVHQRFGDQSTAFKWFVRAYHVNPLQVDVAREASISAMSLGRTEEAISFARSAIQSQPSNGGLQANLALALLLAGTLDEAKMVIDKVMVSGMADPISQTISSMIDHFIGIGQKPPTTTMALESFWNKRTSTAPPGPTN